MGKPPALSASDVAYIREHLSDDNLHDLCERFDVSHTTIRNAALGKQIYSQFREPPPLETWIHQKIVRERMLNTDDIARIVRLREMGKSNDEIAAEYNCSKSFISRIYNGLYRND